LVMPRRETLVFDAAPLIALSAAGFLPHVTRLGVRIVIAEEVRDEVSAEGRGSGTPEHLLLARMLREGAIEVRRVRNRRLVDRIRENPRLSTADATSFCLAVEVGGRLVADDRDLRAAARALDVPLGGSLYILGLAVERKRVTGAEAVQIVERMIRSGWYCSPALLKEFSDHVLGRR